jgi:hypothetical protein
MFTIKYVVGVEAIRVLIIAHKVGIFKSPAIGSDPFADYESKKLLEKWRLVEHETVE